ncbi:hypothetical protein GCM10022238_06980 [Gordonia hankookensis]
MMTVTPTFPSMCDNGCAARASRRIARAPAVTAATPQITTTNDTADQLTHPRRTAPTQVAHPAPPAITIGQSESGGPSNPTTLTTQMTDAGTTSR